MGKCLYDHHNKEGFFNQGMKSTDHEEQKRLTIGIDFQTFAQQKKPEIKWNHLSKMVAKYLQPHR